MEDLGKLLTAREQAKGDWATFENNDSRFPYPRKNYEYVTRIVLNEDATPEYIDRAVAYFDSFSIWIPRAEAYRHLAKNVEEEDTRRLAKSVYSFVKEELPHLHYETEEVEDRLDHALGFLNWAAVASADVALIDEQRVFIYAKLPHLLMEEPSDIRTKKYFTNVIETILRHN